MTGVPIYLVSACSTGEEFVAAFRRYADRGSLFVPIAEPIPAGRRGRFALTLAGGGVLIEGDAEVISSSKVASVLHGRVGMTIRFADLEEPSKSVLVELEKARLVAKPPAPSVAPRMVELPEGPRPKPPAPSVRIDASVALAECTALGDIEALEKSVAAPPKAGPKFVVPSVPPVGAPRPQTPSSVPEPRPRMPSGPQPVIARPKTPSVPPSMPALSPLPKSPSGPVSAPTGFSATMPAVQIGDVAREKVPLDVALRNASKAIQAAETAKTEAMDVPPAPFTPTEMSAVDGPKTTTMDVPPAPLTPTEMAAVPPPPGQKSKDWMLMTVRSAAPPPPTPAPPIVGTPPPKPALEPDLDEPTDLTAMPIIPEVDDRKTSLGMPPMLAEDDRKTSLGMPPMLVEDSGRKTRIGLPAITREPAKSRPPTDDDAPVEIVDTLPAELDSKPTAIDESADTSVTEQPPELSSRVKMPVRPPGQPTVEEPTPSGDWTITPGGDKPTITPRKPGADQTDELQPVAQAADEEIKPPEAPTRVTGNWTIQLDPTSSDGWSEPSKVDATALPDPDKPKKKKAARTKPTPETPPELRPVARSIIMEALPAAPKEAVTPSEEPKVQIDPTLMEAPIVDPNYGAPPPAPPATLSALMPAVSVTQMPVMPEPQAVPIVEHMRLATPVPGTMAPMMPIDRPTPSPIGIDPRVTPLPGTLMAPPFTTPTAVSPANLVSIPTPPPGRLVTDGGVGFFRESGDIANLSGSGSYPVGDSTSLVQARRRTRMLVIGISAGVVVAVGIVLVIMFAGGKKDDVAVETPDAGVVAPPPQNVKVVTPDAGEVAVQPKVDAADAAVVEPPKAPECSVEVITVPPQAEVLLQGSQDVLATTPAKVTLPCGLEARILVRKQRFGSVIRPVTPSEAGESIRVTLAKLMFSVKLSSTPAGAAISVNGGKSVAFTPTTMKLPAFELATITFTKDGFAVDSQKVTPKQNNQTLHSVLKKKPRR